MVDCRDNGAEQKAAQRTRGSVEKSYFHVNPWIFQLEMCHFELFKL